MAEHWMILNLSRRNMKSSASIDFDEIPGIWIREAGSKVFTALENPLPGDRI
jgi:hypothetical protein